MLKTKQALSRIGFLRKQIQGPRAISIPYVKRSFRQVNDLNQLVSLAQ